MRIRMPCPPAGVKGRCGTPPGKADWARLISGDARAHGADTPGSATVPAVPHPLLHALADVVIAWSEPKASSRGSANARWRAAGANGLAWRLRQEQT